MNHLNKKRVEIPLKFNTSSVSSQTITKTTTTTNTKSLMVSSLNNKTEKQSEKAFKMEKNSTIAININQKEEKIEHNSEKTETIKEKKPHSSYFERITIKKVCIPYLKINLATNEIIKLFIYLFFKFI